MKKKLLGFILLCIVIFSCKKNLESYNYGKTEKIRRDLAMINTKYESKGDQTEWWTLKEICAVAVGDIGGAWAGSWAGGKIGGAVGSVILGAGTGAGAAVGAAVGAILIGSAGSYAASPNHRMSQEQTNLLLGMDTNYLAYNPIENTFDISVGQRHNKLLRENLLLNEGSIENDIYQLYSSCTLTENEKIFISEDNGETNSVYTYIGESNSFERIKDLLAEKIEDKLLVLIMQNYIDGISNINSIEDAQNLTYEYEAYINSMEDLSTSQKNTLLHGFAVSKYSLIFWQEILN